MRVLLQLIGWSNRIKFQQFFSKPFVNHLPSSVWTNISCMMHDTIQHLTRAKLDMKIEKKKINLMLFNSYRIHFSVIPFVNHNYKNNNNQTLSVDFIVSCISLPSHFTTITITTNVTTLLCICRMVDLLFSSFDIAKRHAFHQKIVWKLFAHSSCIMHIRI